MAKPNAQDRIFNQRKRKIYRSRIPVGESIFGLVFVVFVGVMTLWFMGQKDAFDPAERDISDAILAQDSVVDTLYQSPMKRWVDPRMAVADAATGGAPLALTLGVFPGTILDGGWEPSSRLQEFDEDTLYEKINGAAPQYVDFGFQRLHYVSVARPAADEEVNIELYDMGEFQNALGIFQAQRGEGTTVEKDGKAFFYMTEAGALGIYEKFYFKLAGNQNTEEIRGKARQIIQALGGIDAGEASTPPVFLAFTDAMGVPFDGVSFVKSDVFYYQFAKDFWFCKPDPESSLQYFAHEAASAEEAQSLFDQVLAGHLNDYDAVEQSSGRVVLKHKFLDEFFAMEVRGAQVIGIEAAPDQTALADALQRLQEAFPHGEEA